MFISPSLLIAIFTGYRWKFGWQFFSFSNLRMLWVSSWSLRFMVRNLLSFKMFSGCFQTFSLLLVFSSLTMMSLGLHFFGFILFGVCWASIIYRLSFVKREMLPTFIFEIFMTQMLDILVVSRSLRLFFFFFFFFFNLFLCVQNVYFYWSIFKFTNCFTLWFPFWYYIHYINFIFSPLELPFGSSL